MRSVRVLMVASNPAFLHAATNVLRQHSRVTEVMAVKTAHEAFTQVSTWRPDVVLMDLWLSDMNGLEVMRQLKARPGAPRVLLMTMNEADAYRDALTAVSDGVLDKTNFVKEFVAFVNALPEENNHVEILPRRL